MRTNHFFSTARYKLLDLSIDSDRARAAELLRAARRFNRRITFKKCGWRDHLTLAAGFAVQEAEEADSDADYRVFDHIAYIMESMIR